MLERLEALETGIPVILLSGHPGSAGGGGRSAAVLSKPTDRTTLLQTVREVLDPRWMIDLRTLGGFRNLRR